MDKQLILLLRMLTRDRTWTHRGKE